MPLVRPQSLTLPKSDDGIDADFSDDSWSNSASSSQHVPMNCPSLVLVKDAARNMSAVGNIPSGISSPWLNVTASFSSSSSTLITVPANEGFVTSLALTAEKYA
jgi:hypothetical protein